MKEIEIKLLAIKETLGVSFWSYHTHLQQVQDLDNMMRNLGLIWDEKKQEYWSKDLDTEVDRKNSIIGLFGDDYYKHFLGSYYLSKLEIDNRPSLAESLDEHMISLGYKWDNDRKSYS